MHGIERNSRQVVILLHGFGASPRWMMLLRRRIARTGRRVISWGYTSWRKPILWHAERLLDTTRSLSEETTVDHIHFVAHSMGSIVCRAALLQDSQLPKVGRVVMLGPPNRGSHVATFFAPVVGRFVPAVRELSSRPQSFVNGLPCLTNIEVGVIAASRDRIVRQQNTHLPCQVDHVIVGCGHLPLLYSREVSRRALRFLETGRFELPEENAIPAPMGMTSVNMLPIPPAVSGDHV